LTVSPYIAIIIKRPLLLKQYYTIKSIQFNKNSPDIYGAGVPAPRPPHAVWF